jgi:hypothetical protein
VAGLLDGLPFQTLPLSGAQNLAFGVELTLMRPGVTTEDLGAPGTASDPPEELRLLPADISDSYFSLLPGEPHVVTVRVRRDTLIAAVASAERSIDSAGRETAHCGGLLLRGWNLDDVIVDLPCP